MKRTTRRNFIEKTSLATVGAFTGINSLTGAISQENGKPAFLPEKNVGYAVKSKRDIMMQVLDMSKTPDYIPAGFFMHFGVNGDSAVKAHLEYFKASGMDFVKIQFDELSLSRNDQIKTPRDWAKLPILPGKWFDPAIYLLKNLIKEAKKDALIIQTLYSTYQMAKQAVPWNLIVEHVKEDAESVCRGMENVMLSIMNFTNAAIRVGVDGFYMCTQGGETNRISDLQHFYRVIKNFDMILYKDVCQSVPFNIMHICDYDGSYNDFEDHFQDYPGQVVNIPLYADNKTLTLNQAADIFKRPVMGGLDRHGIIAKGSPEEIRKTTNEVLKNAPANFILGADCTVDRSVPIENIRAAIETAHKFRS